MTFTSATLIFPIAALKSEVTNHSDSDEKKSRSKLKKIERNSSFILPESLEGLH